MVRGCAPWEQAGGARYNDSSGAPGSSRRWSAVSGAPLGCGGQCRVDGGMFDDAAVASSLGGQAIGGGLRGDEIGSQRDQLADRGRLVVEDREHVAARPTGFRPGPDRRDPLVPRSKIRYGSASGARLDGLVADLRESHPGPVRISPVRLEQGARATPTRTPTVPTTPLTARPTRDGTARQGRCGVGGGRSRGASPGASGPRRRRMPRRPTWRR